MNQTLPSCFAGKIRQVDNCLIWTGARRNGYGCFNNRYTHRLVFIHAFGPIPSNHIVCHKCDNPLCVNPDHLYAGTYKQNTFDMLSKGRSKRTADHYAGEHTCRTCGKPTNDYARCEKCRKIQREYMRKYVERARQ